MNNQPKKPSITAENIFLIWVAILLFYVIGSNIDSDISDIFSNIEGRIRKIEDRIRDMKNLLHKESYKDNKSELYDFGRA